MNAALLRSFACSLFVSVTMSCWCSLICDGHYGEMNEAQRKAVCLAAMHIVQSGMLVDESGSKKRKLEENICIQTLGAFALKPIDSKVEQTIPRIKERSRKMVSILQSKGQAWADKPLEFLSTKISPLLGKDKRTKLFVELRKLKSTTEHNRMIKWLLAFAIHRLYQGRQLPGSQTIRELGNTASELVSESKRVSILLLISFSP